MFLFKVFFLISFVFARKRNTHSHQHSSSAVLKEAYECPEKSSYIDLVDESDQKFSNPYYACSIDYKNPQTLYFALLRVYNCTFSKIHSDNNGAIYIMNNPSAMDNLPKDPIEIVDTIFFKCTSGSIRIESTENDRLYDITQCTFEQCQNTQDCSAIYFQGTIAVIEKCSFIDNEVTKTQHGADIYFVFPSGYDSAEETKMSIKDNIFVRSNSDLSKSSFIYYESAEIPLEFTDNQINVHESVNIKVFDCKSGITDYPKWTIKSNSIFPYREDIIFSDNSNQLPIESGDSFKEGPSYEFPVIKCPNQDDYDTFIEETEDKQEFTENKKVYGCEKTIKNQISTDNCVLGLFHCSFANFEASAVVVKNKNGLSSSKNKIYNCDFSSVKGGCIIIDTDGDKGFYDIFECTFEKCKSEGIKASAISFKAADGKIEKCTFRNNFALDGGDIEFNPSMAEASFNRLVITGNKFERNEIDQGGVFVFFIYKENSRLNLSYNDFSVSLSLDVHLFSCEAKTESYQNWYFIDNCLNPYREGFIRGTNAENLPVDELDSCNIDCPPIPDGYEDSQLLYYSCGDYTDDSSGFYIENSIAAIYYSTFRNIADYMYGAIYINSKIDKPGLPEPTRIYHCDFSSCQSNKGASIYIESVETTRLYDIYRCTFKDMLLSSDDNSDLKGGAIYVNAKQCNIRICECLFEDNKGGSGGAICYVSEWGTQSKALLEDAKDYSLHVLGCVFDNNEASENGGAICISVKKGEVPKPIKIENCTFLNNRANESDVGYENGGAIYYQLESESTSSSSSLTTSEDFSLCVTNCTFIGNYVSYSGGAVFVSILNIKPSKPIEISKSIFDKNRAYNTDEIGVSPSKKGGTGSDIFYYFSSEAAIQNDFCFRVIECNFSNSKSYEKGGSILISVDISKQPSNPVEIQKCSFINCTSEVQDAIYFESTVLQQSLHIDECEFKELSSVYVRATTCNIERSQFVDVKHPILYNCNSPSAKSDIYMLKINNCTFKQKEDIRALVYLYSVNSPTFHFMYNNIAIENADTKVFDVPNDFNKDGGKWVFESNWIEPPEGTYLKTAEAADLPAKCGTGFFCDIQSSSSEEEAETSSSSDEEIVPSSSENQQEEPSSSSSDDQQEEPSSSSSDDQQEEPSSSSSDDQQEEPSSSSSDDQQEEPSSLSIESSDELPSGDYYNGTKCERNQRCKINQDEEHLSSSYVDISASDFDGITEDENGAAIHLINFGIICDEETTFTGCISSKGAGGGIYIYIDKPFEYPVLIRNIAFTSCRATYGGAVYAYCNQEAGEIQIIQCTFIANEATRRKSRDGDNLYGGSAVYLTAMNANIVNCTFRKNFGSGVKIFNDFKAASSKSLKNADDSSVSVSNCLFDVDEESSSSLFYVRGRNKEVDVKVVECTFIGKLKDGSFYIDGISLAEKKKEISRLHINSCKFQSDNKKAVNLRSNNSPSLFAEFDVNSQQFNYMDETKVAQKQVIDRSHNFKLASAVFFLVGVCGVISILIIIMMNRRKSVENTESSDEIASA